MIKSPGRAPATPISASSPLLRYRDNCALVALRQLLPPEVDDARIAAICGTYGYPATHTGRMTWSAVPRAAAALGLVLGPSLAAQRRPVRPTLGEFCRLRPTGTWLVGVTGHSLVVRDGHVVDPNWGGRAALRRLVWPQYTYLVTNAYAPPALAPSDALRFVVPPAHAKRRGTASYTRYLAGWVASCAGARAVALSALAEAGYRADDLRHDLARGYVTWAETAAVPAT